MDGLLKQSKKNPELDRIVNSLQYLRKNGLSSNMRGAYRFYSELDNEAIIPSADQFARIAKKQNIAIRHRDESDVEVIQQYKKYVEDNKQTIVNALTQYYMNLEKAVEFPIWGCAGTAHEALKYMDRVAQNRSCYAALGCEAEVDLAYVQSLLTSLDKNIRIFRSYGMRPYDYIHKRVAYDLMTLDIAKRANPDIWLQKLDGHIMATESADQDLYHLIRCLSGDTPLKKLILDDEDKALWHAMLLKIVDAFELTVTYSERMADKMLECQTLQQTLNYNFSFYAFTNTTEPNHACAQRKPFNGI